MKLETFWITNLRRYRTLFELKRSSFFFNHGSRIEEYLRTPRVFSHSDPGPHLTSFLRIAQWNIEKGKRFDEILKLLQTSEILKWADVIILNEADMGMNRSCNRHVALELAKALGMHMAFGPVYFELTKGTHEELMLDGENRESLQGNAVLSRHPILEACQVQLPTSFEPYEFEEKRFGRRNCLWVRIQLKKSTLWVGSVHLELRNTPECRLRQMVHIMENLPGAHEEPRLLGGDLNTNCFSRGTAWRTAQSALRLILISPSKIKNQLLHPDQGGEPLFGVLRKNGFSWEEFNSNEETARAAIGSLEEADFIPAPLLNAIERRLDPYEGFLCFKLDWLLGKNVRALTCGQRHDMLAGIDSLDPACLRGENSGPNRMSDHLPIYADLDLA